MEKDELSRQIKMGWERGHELGFIKGIFLGAGVVIVLGILTLAAH